MQTYRSIVDDIRSGKLAPVYLLGGEHPYFGRKIEEALLENVVPPQARGFDQIILYGPEVQAADVLAQASAFPMMSERRLVVLREAQALFKQAAARKALEQYLKKPQDTTVLSVRFAGNIPASVKKAAAKTGAVVFESKRIYDNQLPGYVREIFATFGLETDDRAAVMIAEATGADLLRMEKEAEKYALFFPRGSKISPAQVETYTGISKDFNVFELKSAIASGDYPRALRIAEVFAQNPKEHSLLAIVPTLYGFFVQLYAYHTHPDKSNTRRVASDLKINPYFLREYQAAARRYPLRKVSRVMEILRQTDLAAKGYPGGQAGYRDLLHQMIYRIMH